MNRAKRMKEILKASPDFGKRVGYAMCMTDELPAMTDKEMAEEYVKKNCDDSLSSFRGQELKEAYLAGLKAQKEKMKAIGKTSYIKGIRTMANALKEYDKTEGAWTDYFEHKVDEALKMLLKKGVIKEVEI